MHKVYLLEILALVFWIYVVFENTNETNVLSLLVVEEIGEFQYSNFYINMEVYEENLLWKIRNYKDKSQIITTVSTTKQSVEMTYLSNTICSLQAAFCFRLQFLNNDHIFNTKTFTRHLSSFLLSFFLSFIHF